MLNPFSSNEASNSIKSKPQNVDKNDSLIQMIQCQSNRVQYFWYTKTE